MPLPEQDPRLRDKTLIDGAIFLLSEASAAGRTGRCQLEAAIQSVHADRASTGQTDWMALAQLHCRLLRLAPTRASAVGYAAAVAAVADVAGPAEGLAALDKIGADLTGFQPSSALRAHLLARSGQTDAAAQAYANAIAGRAYLQQHRWLERQALRVATPPN